MKPCLKIALIPAYNPDPCLINLVEKLKEKGCALKTVVTVDADGQHRPKDVEMVCKMAQKHPGCLVLGRRKIQKETPFKSRLGNQITRMVYMFTTGIRIYDTQTGLRAFDHTLLAELLTIPGERYEYEMNVLLACSRNKIPMREIGIETIYINDNASSHFHPFQDSSVDLSMQTIRDILKSDIWK